MVWEQEIKTEIALLISREFVLMTSTGETIPNPLRSPRNRERKFLNPSRNGAGYFQECSRIFFLQYDTMPSKMKKRKLSFLISVVVVPAVLLVLFIIVGVATDISKESFDTTNSEQEDSTSFVQESSDTAVGEDSTSFVQESSDTAVGEDSEESNAAYAGAFFFIIALVFAASIYTIYWLEQTKRELQARGADEIPTTWLYIVPIANIYYIYKYAEGAEKVTDGKISLLVILLIYLLAGSAIIMPICQIQYNETA